MENKTLPALICLPWHQTINVSEIESIWRSDDHGAPTIGVTMKSGNVQKPRAGFFSSTEDRDRTYDSLIKNLGAMGWTQG